MKTVHILGAGCSHEDGAPLINNFVEHLNKQINILSKHARFNQFRSVLEFKEKYFADLNIEEYFSLLDYYINLNNSFQGYDIVGIRGDLKYLIARTLLLASDKKSTNYSKYYSSCVRANDTIISLNWDSLLDGVTEELNYSIGFFNYSNDRQIKQHQHAGKRPSILKLHGSVNMFACSKCAFRYLVDYNNAITLIDQTEKCHNCNDGEISMLLIPPTHFKAVDPHLEEVWNCASGALAECDRIRLIGYSMPDADIHFQMLLKAALRRNTKSPQIEVFDYKKKHKDRAEFEAHYQRVFDKITETNKPIKFHYVEFSKLKNYFDKEYSSI